MGKQLWIKVILEKDEDGYHIFAPGLQGCRTWGRTRAEALENIEEALKLYLESLKKHNEQIPYGPHILSSPPTVTAPTRDKAEEERWEPIHA